VAVTYDPDKRLQALAERGLDFEDAKYVFEGTTLEVEDKRKDYREVRDDLLRKLGRPYGGCRVHAAWRGSPRLQHEESK
jgi:uncharacterized DUF497 family protein